MNTSDQFDNMDIPLEQPEVTGRWWRPTTTLEHTINLLLLIKLFMIYLNYNYCKNVLVTNKGNVKHEDQSFFWSETVEVIADKNKEDEDYYKIEIVHSRRISPIRGDLIDEEKEMLKKANKLNVIRRLIGSRSARMSSRKVLGFLVSPQSLQW